MDMIRVLNPKPEEIRASLVITAANETGDRHIVKRIMDDEQGSLVLGIISNNKWNVDPFLGEIEKLLQKDFNGLEFVHQKKLNASQTVSRDLVAPIVERTHFAITGIGD
jgi:hypothetical protein